MGESLITIGIVMILFFASVTLAVLLVIDLENLTKSLRYYGMRKWTLVQMVTALIIFASIVGLVILMKGLMLC